MKVKYHYFKDPNNGDKYSVRLTEYFPFTTNSDNKVRIAYQIRKNDTIIRHGTDYYIPYCWYSQGGLNRESALGCLQLAEENTRELL